MPVGGGSPLRLCAQLLIAGYSRCCWLAVPTPHTLSQLGYYLTFPVTVDVDCNVERLVIYGLPVGFHTEFPTRFLFFLRCHPGFRLRHHALPVVTLAAWTI